MSVKSGTTLVVVSSLAASVIIATGLIIYISTRSLLGFALIAIGVLVFAFSVFGLVYYAHSWLKKEKED